MQEFLKSFPSLGSDRIHRPHAAARNTFTRHGGYKKGFCELSDRVIKRADVNIRIALHHAIQEPSLDFVWMEIAAVQHPKNN